MSLAPFLEPFESPPPSYGELFKPMERSHNEWPFLVQSSYYDTYVKTSVAGLENQVNGYTQREHRLSSEITRVPVQRGGAVTDHIQPEPKEITLTGLVSDLFVPHTPDGPYNDAGGYVAALNVPRGQTDRIVGRSGPWSHAEAAFRQLENLWKSGRLVQVFTSFGTFDNMAIEECRARPQGATGGGMTFTLRLREVEEVRLQTVLIPAPNVSGPAVDRGGTVDRGQQVLERLEMGLEGAPRQESSLWSPPLRTGARLTGPSAPRFFSAVSIAGGVRLAFAPPANGGTVVDEVKTALGVRSGQSGQSGRSGPYTRTKEGTIQGYDVQIITVHPSTIAQYPGVEAASTRALPGAFDPAVESFIPTGAIVTRRTITSGRGQSRTTSMVVETMRMDYIPPFVPAPSGSVRISAPLINVRPGLQNYVRVRARNEQYTGATTGWLAFVP